MANQAIKIKYFMIAYVGLLLVWASFYFGNTVYLLNGLLVAGLYALFDFLWTYARDRVWYMPSSSVISGLILAVAGAPAPSIDLLVLLPLAAVVSKQLIKFGMPRRHIFNPAAFSMILLSIFGYQAVSWWGVAWGKPVLWMVLIAGLFILWRQSRWETAVSFFIFYAIFLSALFFFLGLWGGNNFIGLLLLLKPQLIDGAAIFFSTAMLIEPITSSFSGTRNRMVYGILVALFAVLVTALGQRFPYDPMLSGLLLGNLIMNLKTIFIYVRT